MKSLILFSTLFLSTAVFAQQPTKFGRQVSESGIKHSFLICGPKTVIVNENDEIVWETKGYARDGFVLPNGNVLLRSAEEQTSRKKSRARAS